MSYNTYSCIDEIKIMIDIYDPDDIISLLNDINKSFHKYDISKGLMGDFWLAIAKNGECAFFNE